MCLREREKAGNEGNGMALCKKSVIYRSDSSHTVDLGIVKKKFEFIMPENSAGIIRLKPLE